MNHLSPIDTGIEPLVAKIHNELAEFSEYLERRKASFSEALKDAERLWDCPRCSQETLVSWRGNPTCPFCGYTDIPIEVIFAGGGGDVLSH
jgi:hypothetical protein